MKAGRKPSELTAALVDVLPNDHNRWRRLERFATRYGFMPGDGSGSTRHGTAAEIRALRLHLILSPDPAGNQPPNVALVDRVTVAAHDHPEARFIVAHPDWVETCDTAEEVVEIHGRRGGVCTVVDTTALLGEAS